MSQNCSKKDESELRKLHSAQLSLQNLKKWLKVQRCWLNVSAVANLLLGILSLAFYRNSHLLTVPFLRSYYLALLPTNTLSSRVILKICDQLEVEDFLLENAKTTIFTSVFWLKACFYGFALLTISTVYTLVQDFITSNF